MQALADYSELTTWGEQKRALKCIDLHNVHKECEPEDVVKSLAGKDLAAISCRWHPVEKTAAMHMH